MSVWEDLTVCDFLDIIGSWKLVGWGKMGFKAQTCWTNLLEFWGVWNRSRILNFGPDRLFFWFSRALLWVLIRSASARHFWWVPTTYVFMENKKNIMWIPLIYLDLWISTWKRAKIRKDIFFTSWIFVDDQLVLQSQWSIMKFWPIPNTYKNDPKSEHIMQCKALWKLTRALLKYLPCYVLCNTITYWASRRPGNIEHFNTACTSVVWLRSSFACCFVDCLFVCIFLCLCAVQTVKMNKSGIQLVGFFSCFFNHISRTSILLVTKYFTCPEWMWWNLFDDWL